MTCHLRVTASLKKREKYIGLLNVRLGSLLLYNGIKSQFYLIIILLCLIYLYYPIIKIAVNHLLLLSLSFEWFMFN